MPSDNHEGGYKHGDGQMIFNEERVVQDCPVKQGDKFVGRFANDLMQDGKTAHADGTVTYWDKYTVME